MCPYLQLKEYFENSYPFKAFEQSFFAIFLGVQGKNNYFLGSISMAELIFWADGSYPSVSTPIPNIYEYPMGNHQCTANVTVQSSRGLSL